MELTNKELYLVRGGGITASWINYLAKGINSLLEVGRSLGSSIRRIATRKLC